MLKRILAFSSDRFCWHSGTPVKESYLKESKHNINVLKKTHEDKQSKEYEVKDIFSSNITAFLSHFVCCYILM